MRTRLEVLSCARNRSRQNVRLGPLKRLAQNGPARNRITVAPIEKYAEKENPAESCAQRRRGSPLRMVCKKAILQDYGRECGASGSKITRKCKTGWKNVLPVWLVCVCSFVQKPKRKTGLKSRNPFDVRIRNIFKKKYRFSFFCLREQGRVREIRKEQSKLHLNSPETIRAALQRLVIQVRFVITIVPNL